MTPPEHILIGFSISNMIYSIGKIAERKFFPYLFMVFFAVSFVMLPDFDSFLGNYTSTNVYIGHRGITHSILFVALASAAAVPAIWLYETAANQSLHDDRERKLRYAAFFLLVFVSGISHLLADLPQPAGPWGGIPIFYPYRSNGGFLRSGGWARLGWYDYRVMWTFFETALASAMTVLMIVIAERMNISRAKKILAAALLAINIGAHVWLVDHVGNSRYISSSHWEKVQDEFLARSNPLARDLTLRGRDFFLKLFFSVR